MIDESKTTFCKFDETYYNNKYDESLSESFRSSYSDTNILRSFNLEDKPLINVRGLLNYSDSSERMNGYD